MTALKVVFRGAGLVLMVVGGLTIVVIGVSLLFPGTGSVAGGLVVVGAGLVLFGGGYLLVRVNAAPAGRGMVQVRHAWFRRWGLVIGEVLVCGLSAAFAVVGINTLASGADPADAGLPLALVPLGVLSALTLELARRQARQAVQFLAVGSGFALFGIVLIVFGITADDVGRLVLGLVAALSGLASSVAGRRA